MGKGLVEELKKEFPIRDEWVSFEIHPETPPQGVLLSERFPEAVLNRMFQNIRAAGDSLGIRFGELARLSNSRRALEASEYARDQRHYDSFHAKVFHAYFTDIRDIGSLDVLLDLARADGLDTDELTTALEERRYASRLDEAHAEARQLGITAVPTFIVNGGERIIGAQSIDFFRNMLRQIQAADAS
ncbi:MAG: DsbA family protein [Deltaproteobacteria bacterium]